MHNHQDRTKVTTTGNAPSMYNVPNMAAPNRHNTIITDRRVSTTSSAPRPSRWMQP